MSKIKNSTQGDAKFSGPLRARAKSISTVRRISNIVILSWRQSVERAGLERVATLHALRLHAPRKKSGGPKLFLHDPVTALSVFRTQSRTKQSATNSDHRRSFFNRNLEIATHAHAQVG